MPERVRRAMDVPMEDQRAPDLPDFTLPLFEDLKRVFQSQDGQVFLFPASGTGGWEAAVPNTLSPGDKVLAARFGQFSQLWIDLCQRHGLEVEIVDAEWGEGVPLELYADILAADQGRKIKAVLACHNETATGGGDMMFNIDGNAGGTAAQEHITLRSRWESNGAGRADARMAGGDLQTGAIASGCWDTSFRRTYYTDSVNFAPTEGAVSGCAFGTVDLPPQH